MEHVPADRTEAEQYDDGEGSEGEGALIHRALKSRSTARIPGAR